MDETLDLDVTGIAHGGVCVARHEGRVVFVADAIPGERVRARLDPSIPTPPSSRRSALPGASEARGPGSGVGAENKRFWRATTLEVLDASPHRRPHIWAAADVDTDPVERPGGADLGHIDLAHQRSLKRRVLQDSLDRFAGGGIEAPDVEALDDSDGTQWRTRLTLHVDDDGRIGPYAARSRRVIEVADHPLVRPAVAGVALGLRAAKPGRVMFVEPGDGRARVIPLPDKGARSDRGARPEPEVVYETVGERRFEVDAGGFWQVHPLAAATLDRAVRGLLEGRIDPDKTHLDLYGGVGLLAATLSDLGARRVISVESDARATAHAAENVAGIEAVTARVDRFLARFEGAQTRGGAIVLDPPRAGAGRAVVEAVARLHPKAIVYVACDPVALARDLGTFRALGYEARALSAFDLFPHSHHFETIALLTMSPSGTARPTP